MSSPGSRWRRLAFAGLYLCEGAPIGFLWWALPTILRERGVPVDRIGALSSWLVLPWALKFLWAPLVDSGRGPGPRAWIVGTQLIMAVTLPSVLALDLEHGFGWIACALVLHAVAAASQDAAIDSLAIRTTPPEERGSLNGWMQLGMLLGRSLFGGGALLARRWIGDGGLVLVLSVGLAAAALGLALRGRGLATASAALADPATMRMRLASALRRRTTWLGLLFAATSGAGFEATGVLAGPLLIDRGLNAGTVGLFFGLPAVGAMALGAVLGGHASDRLGLRRVVLASALALGTTVLVLAGLARATVAPGALLVTLTVIYVGIGIFTASSYALFMGLTDPALGATQFSAFMGATNLCESWSARLGGVLAVQRGYAAAFTYPTLIGLAALPLLLALRPRPSAGSTSTGDRVDSSA